MQLEAVVSFGEHFALYHLTPEGEGVYHAELIKFYGSPENAPPKQILLIKGIRKWIGNYALPELLNDLGKAIENAFPEKEKVAQPSKGEDNNSDSE